MCNILIASFDVAANAPEGELQLSQHMLPPLNECVATIPSQVFFANLNSGHVLSCCVWYIHFFAALQCKIIFSHVKVVQQR